MLTKAIRIAIEAHKGQTDKYGVPYIGHVMRVMEAGQTESEKIVGALHDLIEDTEWTLDDLAREGFPDRILQAVEAMTRDKEKEPYDRYLDRLRKNPLAVRVKLNDLTDNMDIRRIPYWDESRVEKLKKYHKAYRLLTAE